jgi:regulatory protein
MNAARKKQRRGPAKIAVTAVDVSTLDEPIVVTALTESQGRQGRVSVSINQRAVGDVTVDYIADSVLRPGQRMERRDVDDLVAAVNRTAVLDKALDLLAVRARSGRDLRVRLRRAGAQDGPIDWAVERLTSQGYVDDAAYAMQVARTRVLAGGVSKRRVVSILRQRGISAETAQDAIDATLQEVSLDETGAALEAARKRARALSSLDPRVRRQRLHAFLARRGYTGDTVRKVLKEVLG